MGGHPEILSVAKGSVKYDTTLVLSRALCKQRTETSADWCHIVEARGRLKRFSRTSRL